MMSSRGQAQPRGAPDALDQAWLVHEGSGWLRSLHFCATCFVKALTAVLMWVLFIPSCCS